MDLEVRTLAGDDMESWGFLDAVAFGSYLPDGWEDIERSLMPMDRVFGTFDRGRLVGATASYPFDMTVPGGASLPVAGVTAVAVAPTHRRRGILTEMKRHQLDDVAARGESAAILNASESLIYPRYGYGLASLDQSLSVDATRSAFGRVPHAAGETWIVPKAEAAPLVAAAWDRCRPHTPGVVSGTAAGWYLMLGDTVTCKGGGMWFVVVHHDADGDADGYALYTVEQKGMPGHWVLSVRELTAADPGVRAALWRQLLDTDLVGRVEMRTAPMDEPLRWWLRDSRQAMVTAVHDFLWVRPLDVEAFLSARVFGGDEALVVEVADTFRPETEGCYRIEPAGAGPGRCVRTDDEPDLAMEVGELGALSLGGVATPTFLARAGRIDELRPGALAVADCLFGWPVAPFCATRF